MNRFDWFVDVATDLVDARRDFLIALSYSCGPLYGDYFDKLVEQKLRALIRIARTVQSHFDGETVVGNDR